ncbi:MAG TPA: hypothetical protein VGU68_09645, partial [Ktedonobacteraceae bacterium]|nr:hypothetical protein [Ktedonobacteraceae bacterium]
GKGLKALVLGAGPVGLLGAMLFIAAGFETYVYSRSQVPNAKADLVEAIGGTYISSETTAVEQLAGQIGAIDLVFEASGAPQLVFDVMRVSGTNAIFVLAGAPEHTVLSEVDIAQVLLDRVGKNQVILGTVNAGRAAFEAALRDLAIFKRRWPQALRSLITGRYPIEQAPQLLLGNMRGIKNIVTL